LFQNNKDGTFKNIYSSSGIVIPIHDQTVGAAAADLDNDGDKDLIVTTNERADPYLFENRDGKFYDISIQAGLEAKLWNTAVSFIDYDLDGDLDIYLSSYVGANGGCDRNLFYENLGDLRFKEIGLELGLSDQGCSLASTFSDYDNDGDFDLLVANDFGLTVQSNKIFENLYPEKKFVDVSETSGFNALIFGMGIEGGDFDEDGDMDYYTTNIGPNKFYVNNNNKTMTEKGVQYGLDNKYKKGTDSLATSWGIHWFDYNHDSYLDLFVSNGNVVLTDSVMSFMDPNLLYRNNGDKTFTEVGEEEGIADPKKGRGIGLIDFDNDGDMDIVQSVVTGQLGAKSETDDDRVNFFKSNASENGNHWIQFNLRGTVDNRDAIGSKIAIFFNGRKLIAETPSGGSSYMSQRTGIIHFGLGSATSIDRVEVTFPNGEKVIRSSLNADARYNITQTFRTTINADICYGDRYNKSNRIYKDTVIIENYKTIDDVDSVVTVNINVYDEIVVDEFVELCFGGEFNGITWKNDGETEEVKRSYLGCDSTIVYKITVLPAQETTIDTAVCYGGLFDNLRITRDRVIRKEMNDPNGCDSILVYNVTVNDGPNFSETFEVCQGETYKDILVMSDTTLFNSFKTISGCDSIYEEKVVMLPSGIRDTVVNIYSD
ncbi:MAG: CRTAC1 family protein, partial [Candidatus Kapaibacterium sp.]